MATPSPAPVFTTEPQRPELPAPALFSGGRGQGEGMARGAGTVFRDNVWQAPLVPTAAALTAGIVLDRYAKVPLTVSLLLVVAGLVAWLTTRAGRQPRLGLVYLCVAVAAFGSGYHHARRHLYRADDVGNYASAAPLPTVALVRGVIEQEPTISKQPEDDPLSSMSREDATIAVLRVSQLNQGDDWLPVSGRARLRVVGHLSGLHVGDEVEVVGRLEAPPSPANPGEFDFAAMLQDDHIRAQLVVGKTTAGVTRLARGWPRSLDGWLGVVRGWGQRALEQALPADTSGVATALLLGEGSAMTADDWEKYIRTGVIHVLAISGQHLVVLAAFLWLTLRLCGITRRRGAWFVALFLLAYALLAGGRPPVLRSAVTVCACCAGIYLRRPALSANSFALAWIVVALLNPTDLSGAGCQLSFLAVAVLYWGTGPWLRRQPEALDRLVEQSRPGWERVLRRILGSIAMAYAVTLAIWLAAAPLVAARYHLVSPIGLLIGPPVVLLTSVALVAGFLLLLASAVCWPLVPLLGQVTHWSLTGCELIVTSTDRWPASHWYVSDIPDWWLWVFYAAFLVLLTVPVLPLASRDGLFSSKEDGRSRGTRGDAASEQAAPVAVSPRGPFSASRLRLALLGGLIWLCVGLGTSALRPASDELRCTFLAVGHGGCTVLETPDGRTLLYDAGTMQGPEVTRRQIAPFLWSRGIRRIDEIFLSHADLDHFNGLPALVERFAVGQVSHTPTFAEKTILGVPVTLAALERQRIPVRILRAGDRLTAGQVEIEVLHPPAAGREGNENARSMVLLVRHAGHSLLLSGDLEGPGLERVLRLPAPPIDVLMAPHHGSRVANKPELATWARPKVVVSCEGRPRGPTRPAEPYTPSGAQFLGTWPHGAVTIRSHATGLVIETFQTGQRLVVRRGGGQ